jgi:hypothetical protein
VMSISEPLRIGKRQDDGGVVMGEKKKKRN